MTFGAADSTEIAPAGRAADVATLPKHVRPTDLHWQTIAIDKNAHARLMGQKPCVIWFTGISAAGKSTIANILEKRASRPPIASRTSVASRRSRG